MHSMYVVPRHAATAAYLLLKMLDDPEMTLTALSPSARVTRILRGAGFKPLETGSRLYPPLANPRTLARWPARILRATGAEPWLAPADAALLRDHAAHGCRGHAIVDKSGYALVITRRGAIRQPRWARVSDVLHVSDPRLLARHFEQAKLTILWRDRAQALRVDDRMMGEWKGCGISRPRSGLFHSGTLDARRIDNLYSEALFHDTLILVEPVNP
jgi:hypothetical protein